MPETCGYLFGTPASLKSFCHMYVQNQLHTLPLPEMVIFVEGTFDGLSSRLMVLLVPFSTTCSFGNVVRNTFPTDLESRHRRASAHRVHLNAIIWSEIAACLFQQLPSRTWLLEGKGSCHSCSSSGVTWPSPHFSLGTHRVSVTNISSALCAEPLSCATMKRARSESQRSWKHLSRHADLFHCLCWFAAPTPESSSTRICVNVRRRPSRPVTRKIS